MLDVLFFSNYFNLLLCTVFDPSPFILKAGQMILIYNCVIIDFVPIKSL